MHCEVLQDNNLQQITRSAFASECKDASCEAGMTLKTEERSLLKLMPDIDLHSCKVTELCLIKLL